MSLALDGMPRLARRISTRFFATIQRFAHLLENKKRRFIKQHKRAKALLNDSDKSCCLEWRPKEKRAAKRVTMAAARSR
jgi:hypothetical protein